MENLFKNPSLVPNDWIRMQAPELNLALQILFQWWKMEELPPPPSQKKQTFSNKEATWWYAKFMVGPIHTLTVRKQGFTCQWFWLYKNRINIRLKLIYFRHLSKTKIKTIGPSVSFFVSTTKDKLCIWLTSYNLT